jgi:DNA-binding NarL/FixJ family response regulator
MCTIKIGVIDDHKIVRNGIKAVFHNNSEIKVVYESGTALKLLNEPALLEKLDVIIIDIDIPDLSGIEFVIKAMEIKPDIKVLIFSAYSDEHHVVSAVRAGAKGYVSKDADNIVLINAVKEVNEGNEYFGGEASKIVFKKFAIFENENSKNVLSNRELRIIKYIAQGLSVKDISEKLFVSSRTIEADKSSIMIKLGVTNIIDLVKYAIKENIVNV